MSSICLAEVRESQREREGDRERREIERMREGEREDSCFFNASFSVAFNAIEFCRRGGVVDLSVLPRKAGKRKRKRRKGCVCVCMREKEYDREGER